MTSENLRFDRALVKTWTLATFTGWILGVPVITAIALLGEAIGIGGKQVLVGVGMGVSVGFMQGRVAGRLIEPARWPWFWSWVIGMAVPFLLIDITNAIDRPFLYPAPTALALAGAIAGVWQARILARTIRNSRWWVYASVVGFILAAAMEGAAEMLIRSQSMRGVMGALAFLSLIVGGGLVLGLVTGLALSWLRRPASV